MLYESPSYARLLGEPLAAIFARHGTTLAVVHPDDYGTVRETFQRIRASGSSARIEWRLHAADGSWRTFDGIAFNHTDNPAVGGVVITNRDITEYKVAEAALRESEVRFRTLVELAPVGACIMDEQGCFEVVNDAYAALFGYRRDELIGHHFVLLFDPATQEQCREWYGEQVRTAATVQQEHEMINRGGERLIVLTGSIAFGGRDGRRRRAAFVTDLTAQKRLTQRLAHAAHHDALTGLPNRVLFQDRLEQALRTAMREQAHLGLMPLDLDGFKAVNDTNGHAVGDALLAMVGARLKACLRGSDTVARLGGDEFGVLLPHAGGAGGVRVASKYPRRVDEAV